MELCELVFLVLSIKTFLNSSEGLSGPAITGGRVLSLSQNVCFAENISSPDFGCLSLQLCLVD